MNKNPKTLRSTKPPAAPMIHKPPGVSLDLFLIPFFQAIGDAYKSALSHMIVQAGIAPERAQEALNSVVVQFITRWHLACRVPVVRSWQALLLHQAAHVLHQKPRKDQRLISYAPFESGLDRPGLPHPPARELPPLEQAIQNEEARAARRTVQQLPPNQYWAVTLWSQGLSFKLIGAFLGVSESRARSLKLWGSRKLRKVRLKYESA